MRNNKTFTTISVAYINKKIYKIFIEGSGGKRKMIRGRKNA